jgi:hypothetical protein
MAPGFNQRNRPGPAPGPASAPSGIVFALRKHRIPRRYSGDRRAPGEKHQAKRESGMAEVKQGLVATAVSGRARSAGQAAG